MRLVCREILNPTLGIMSSGIIFLFYGLLLFTMNELATDCFACESENLGVILILGIIGIALGIYLIRRFKKESKGKKV
jgi:hypothetical protein